MWITGYSLRSLRSLRSRETAWSWLCPILGARYFLAHEGLSLFLVLFSDGIFFCGLLYDGFSTHEKSFFMRTKRIESPFGALLRGAKGPPRRKGTGLRSQGEPCFAHPLVFGLKPKKPCGPLAQRFRGPAGRCFFSGRSTRKKKRFLPPLYSHAAPPPSQSGGGSRGLRFAPR